WSRAKRSSGIRPRPRQDDSPGAASSATLGAERWQRCWPPAPSAGWLRGRRRPATRGRHPVRCRHSSRTSWRRGRRRLRPAMPHRSCRSTATRPSSRTCRWILPSRDRRRSSRSSWGSSATTPTRRSPGGASSPPRTGPRRKCFSRAGTRARSRASRRARARSSPPAASTSTSWARARSRARASTSTPTASSSNSGCCRPRRA
ncbi:MAG: hypothetical protein AVDCRST_MAG49-67, partial [uncultured Thermomicrobiales bacterium]